MNRLPLGESARFVILHHTVDQLSGRTDHYDFMLESGISFLTMEILELPTKGKSISARLLPNHRLEYWDIEGPISGNRGSVKRISRGLYQTLELSPQHWTIALASPELSARLRLAFPEASLANQPLRPQSEDNISIEVLEYHSDLSNTN